MTSLRGRFLQRKTVLSCRMVVRGITRVEYYKSNVQGIGVTNTVAFQRYLRRHTPFIRSKHFLQRHFISSVSCSALCMFLLRQVFCLQRYKNVRTREEYNENHRIGYIIKRHALPQLYGNDKVKLSPCIYQCLYQSVNALSIHMHTH